MDFEFIREGEVIHHTSIASFLGDLGKLQPLPETFADLERHLRLFAAEQPISIRSAKRLAEMMASKAAIIKGEVDIALKDDPEFQTTLGRQYTVFKQNLLPNLTPEEFADLYAETITYGMFAARLHDTRTPEDFTRSEALELLPKSNPFLRGLFQTIAGYDLPEWLRYAVDDLVAVLRASRPHDLFKDFGQFTARNDPFIHFYETFLAEYNPKKRKARGVWYTPEPVVDFIVRAVDDVLKSEFGIADGLADTQKVTVDWDTGQDDPKTGKPRTIRRDVHRVQILDPATGTGTFLAKTVQTIADRVKPRAPGQWSRYVERDLLPRLHGFELLMASYAMCHMKLDMQLTESGYTPSTGKPPEDWPTGKQWPPRLSVWLTNALEPAEREVKDLFALQALADEARGAGDVKRQTPIMCVIGNPPYSGESANKGKHIMGLMEAYKMEPGGKERLKERNPKWINDDYVKFIRMSEELIAKNPSGGVLGFITNHGYLDNPTFRGMRWHLLKTFDKIWVLDLHGNAKKKEVSPDGSPDKNVFDIQQGVALIVAVRKGEGSDKLAEVWHGDLWGSRHAKSQSLDKNLLSLSSTELEAQPYNFPFVPRDWALRERYEESFAVNDLLPINSVGIVTARDALVIDGSRSELWKRLQTFSLNETESLREQFRLGNDVRDWRVEWAQKDVRANLDRSKIVPIAYRPFDSRWTFYTGNSRGFMCYPRHEVMRQMLRDNLSLMSPRQAIQGGAPYSHVTVIDEIVDNRYVFSNKGIAQQFPLYLYPDEDIDQSDALAPKQRAVNFDPKLYAAICKAAGIDPADQAGPEDDFRAATGDARPSEVKVFDYIYGVLHSPDYRATFAEFLKIDFPRIPYPASPDVFHHVSEKGEVLRRLHLMEPAVIGEALYPFAGDVPEGEEDSVVAAGHPKFVSQTSGSGSTVGRVHINAQQYFDSVPETAWEFHIGGYQPAQKWLKDRKGRTLSYEDLNHYMRIVKILLETDRIMREIELPLESGT
ncbi:type ISP restriction/modification enzyme [Qipengyuania sp. JC766]|uniref:type ISP restriction/modification enzyme n=1 Tax=Qipengyuania sp. JC766 TaxID=3232139 RepID=UPI00345951CD